MNIKHILNQHRRDFTAYYACEHCDYTEIKEGYDDANFHEHVIPEMKCSRCGKKASENYRALTTKYSEGTIV